MYRRDICRPQWRRREAGFVHQRSKEGSGGTASMAIVWTTRRGTGKSGTPLASLSKGRPIAVTVDENNVAKRRGQKRIRTGSRAEAFSSGMYQGTQTDSLSEWYTNSPSHA